MTKTSVLNDALNAINNAEKTGKRQVMIRPSSKVIVKFLSVMQRHGRSHHLAYMSKEEVTAVDGNVEEGEKKDKTMEGFPG